MRQAMIAIFSGRPILGQHIGRPLRKPVTEILLTKSAYTFRNS